jgi:serine/threonine protein kinase
MTALKLNYTPYHYYLLDNKLKHSKLTLETWHNLSTVKKNHYIKKSIDMKYCDNIEKDNIKIGNLMGSGGLSKVYNAISTTGKVCVLKKTPIRISNVSSRFIKKSFLNEIRILSTINNDKYIIQMKHNFEDDKYYNIIYENTTNYLPLSKLCNWDSINSIDSLDYIIINNNLCSDIVRHISKQIISAVDNLHIKYGIIHTDIKPHNIIYNPKTYDIKLIDFGGSICLNNLNSKKSIFPGGTKYYSSPEILGKSVVNLTKEEWISTDNWALMCTIIELYFKKTNVYILLMDYPEILDKFLHNCEEICPIYNQIDIIKNLKRYTHIFYENLNITQSNIHVDIWILDQIQILINKRKFLTTSHESLKKVVSQNKNTIFKPISNNL